MTAKQLFLQDEKAVAFLLVTVKSTLFEKACLHAKQQWQDNTKGGTLALNAEQIYAVNAFLDTLRGLPIDESTVGEMPSPHMHHDLDNIQRKPRTSTKDKKK